jgi:alpha-amylase
LLATLSRRPEAYHQTILHAAGVDASDDLGKGLHEQVKFKHKGLERLLHYDHYLRKSLIDHFYEPGVTLAELTNLRETELGDFVAGAYTFQVKRSGRRVQLLLQRAGRVAGAAVRVTKEVTIEADSDTLAVRYVLDDVPSDRPLHFAVEFNFAGMAAGADDRYFYHDGQARAGQLQTLQDLERADRIGLVDEWLGLDVSLALSRPGGIWAFPIQTVSQSEGGFELVHQSTAVLPHWHVQPDAHGRWEVLLDLKLDTARAEARTLAATRS